MSYERQRKGAPVAPATLSEGDIIILPDGRKAVVTGRPADNSCTYRTDKGEEGTIERLTPDAYDRRYGWVDPESETFTDKDIWHSKSIAIIDTPDNCYSCPFAESNGKGSASCYLMWHKWKQTGEYGDIEVMNNTLEDLKTEGIDKWFFYRNPHCPLTDIKPYQPKDRSNAILDFTNALEHEEFKLIRRNAGWNKEQRT